MDTRPLRTFAFLILALAPVWADQVIMKDGTVYKGKIMIDTDKAVLIGNPPFDPNSYLLQSEDIEKIIYEEYHSNPPSVRKRGLTFETRLNGNITSSEVEFPGILKRPVALPQKNGARPLRACVAEG